MNESNHSHLNDLIRISLNGNLITSGFVDLASLLAMNGIDPEQPGIAVAVNDTVVQRAEWGQTRIGDGDRVEIITAMQGG
ncbi:MAG: sulfur carrier protein ThiS [Chlorobi bacterium]|nr:sulfur carrier protein ThiS [Chlorobiota bacterium]